MLRSKYLETTGSRVARRNRPETDRRRTSATRDRRAFRCVDRAGWRASQVCESVRSLAQHRGALGRDTCPGGWPQEVKAESTRAFLTLPFGDSRPRPHAGVQEHSHPRRERVGAEHDHGDVPRARVVTEKTEHLLQRVRRLRPAERRQPRPDGGSSRSAHALLDRGAVTSNGLRDAT